jgi:uncharacterized membrane protein YczE
VDRRDRSEPGRPGPAGQARPAWPDEPAGSLARVFVSLPAAEVRRRLPRLLLGLALCGVGIALMVEADLGLAPWDVLHQGLSERTGIPIGTMNVLVGAAVLLAWLPLRERLGPGTVLNVLVIGFTVDGVLALLPHVEPIAVRAPMVVAGVLAFGIGSGFYIGAGLGPGPRDGLMTGIARRWGSVRVVRTVIEVAALAVGFALGGGVGVGTVLFAVGIGPVVHYALDRLTVPAPGAAPRPSITPSSVT